MYVIVTCKYEKDLMKNSLGKVATPVRLLRWFKAFFLLQVYVDFFQTLKGS